MKFKISLIVSCFMAFFMFSDSFADTITVRLSTKDKKLSSEIDSEELLSGKAVYKVYAYIKIDSDTSNVKENTLYLEWRRKYNDVEEVLSNYNTDNKWLIYERRLCVITDYYRVHKTIFASNPGEYYFIVYNKDNTGRYIPIEKKEITIQENGR